MGNSDRWIEILITDLLFFSLFSSLDAGGGISGVTNPTFAPTAPIMVQFWLKMKTIDFFNQTSVFLLFRTIIFFYMM